MKKLNIYLIALIFFLSSCSKYMQLYNINALNVQKVNNSYVFENDSVSINYNFWNLHGLMSFTLYNKLNVPIYIDWKKCSYISNSFKSDYWIDREYISTKSTQNSYFYNPNNKNPIFPFLFLSSNVASSSVVKREERITFIPPKSNISRSDFVIFPFNGIKLSNDAFIDSNMLKKEEIAYYQCFNKSNSPIVCRNFLSYSTSETFTTEFYIDNEFYIDSVAEMNFKYFNQVYSNPRSFFNFCKRSISYKRLKLLKRQVYENLKAPFFYTEIGSHFGLDIKLPNNNIKNEEVEFCLRGIFGKHIDKLFFIGLNTGIDLYKSILMVPVTSELKLFAFRGKISPFVYSNVGYSFELRDSQVLGGTIFSFGVGARKFINNENSINLKVGFTTQSIIEKDSWLPEKKYKASFISTTIGYSF